MVVEGRVRPVRLDRIKVRPAPRWLQRLWLGPVSAMTLPWAIYIRPEVLADDPVRLGPLLIHELAHARQWQKLGLVRFTARYLTDYLRGRLRGLSHRQAYLGISLEVEAREIAGM